METRAGNSDAVLQAHVPGAYPSTIWSEVGRAGRPGDERSLAALEALVNKYYRPLRKHVQVAFQVEEDTAADWLHDFAHRKIILGNLLQAASRDKGRFRTFLLNSLDNFVCSEKRRANTLKRRPKEGFVSMDELPEGAEPLDSAPQIQAFVVDWAREIVEETLTRMKAECVQKGQQRRWDLFEARLLRPALDGDARLRYDALVGQLGFESPAEASNCLITARRQFLRLLHEVVAEYVGEEGVEEEVRELKRALAG
jgi:hypothetical protein